MHRFRSHLTYANVMSTLAVFIALGGSSYAAVTINGANVKHRSISGTKLKRNTVTGLEVRESRLGRVPRAAVADRVGGFTGDELKVRCPLDMFPAAGTCIERVPRDPASYGVAVNECLTVGRPAGPGRRLPSHNELRVALGSVPLAPGGELTSNVYPSTTYPGELDALYIADDHGNVALVPNRGDFPKAFRCAADLIN